MTRKRKRKLSPRDNPRAYKRLKALSFYDELDKRIKANIAIEELARWIQEDKVQLVDMKRESLVRQLYRYKSEIPPGEIAEVEPLFFAKAIERMKRGVDEIEELEKLYLFQLNRISMDAETEQKINKLFPGMFKEIQLAADLLDKMMEKKMELGILSKEPEKFNVTGGIGTLDLTGGAEFDDDTRTRMGMLAGKLIDTLDNLLEDKESESK